MRTGSSSGNRRRNYQGDCRRGLSTSDYGRVGSGRSRPSVAGLLGRRRSPTTSGAAVVNHCRRPSTRSAASVSGPGVQGRRGRPHPRPSLDPSPERKGGGRSEETGVLQNGEEEEVCRGRGPQTQGKGRGKVLSLSLFLGLVGYHLCGPSVNNDTPYLTSNATETPVVGPLLQVGIGLPWARVESSAETEEHA